MTDCDACATPDSGLIRAGCRQCTLRDLAAGPLFWASMRAGKLTPEYQKALAALGQPGDVHREVKAAAKTVKTGAIPA
jgi:hypothetical protein